MNKCVKALITLYFGFVFACNRHTKDSSSSEMAQPGAESALFEGVVFKRACSDGTGVWPQ